MRDVLWGDLDMTTRADLRRAAILFIDLSAPPELKRSYPEAENLPNETKIRLEKNNTS